MSARSFASMCASLALLLAWPATAATDQCGDADANGTRTVTDGVLVLRTAAALTGGCTVASRCDIDGSGTITVTDGVAALRLAAGLPVETACATSSIDVADFNLFEFSNFLSFGYCPRLGAPTRFSLFHDAGQLARSATILVAGNPDDPDCLTDAMPVPPAACVKPMQLPTRVLTADEEARVRSVFAAITVERRRHPDCGKLPIEPCLIEDFKWDGFEVTDFACGEPRLPPDQAAALDELMQSLL
jgi:hypothetical protein